MRDTNVPAGSPEARHGVQALFFAYILWGSLPIYWKQLGHVPALEVICHRSVWCLAFVVLVLTVMGGWQELRAEFWKRDNLIFMGLGSLVHLCGWLGYIWGVNSGQILAVSLGQYIVPLMSILIGFLLFREPLGRLQWLAIALAGIGVGLMIVRYGHFPTLSLVLASLSVLYTVLRKQAPIGVVPGMVMEVGFNSLVAISYLLWAFGQGTLNFLSIDIGTDLLLMGAGVVTAVPQLFFTYGIKRTNMITLGFLQYVLPTCVISVGIFIYKEPFTPANMVGFGFIWAALAVYSYDAFRKARAVHQLKK